MANFNSPPYNILSHVEFPHLLVTLPPPPPPPPLVIEPQLPPLTPQVFDPKPPKSSPSSPLIQDSDIPQLLPQHFPHNNFLPLLIPNIHPPPVQVEEASVPQDTDLEEKDSSSFIIEDKDQFPPLPPPAPRYQFPLLPNHNRIHIIQLYPFPPFPPQQPIRKYQETELPVNLNENLELGVLPKPEIDSEIEPPAPQSDAENQEPDPG